MKPLIVCHIVGATEGKLQTRPLSSPNKGLPKNTLHKINELITDKLGAQGWIVSSKNMKKLARGKRKLIPETQRNLHQTFIGHRRGSRITLTIDPDGKLYYGKSHSAKDHFVAMLSTQVSGEYLTVLREEGISYVFAGETGNDYHQALGTLYQDFGVEILLLDGGDVIIGQFLQEGLIDELSLLFYPGIKDLSSSTSLLNIPLDIKELLEHRWVLRLISCESLENGFIWMRYAIEKKQ
ncbi:dihydrofolate reductase family protein [Serratia marcescens]|uniref:dihydrofolate reductase family protein n=1 Tax=Serratia marcescens TaxID=615 RepID=UPI002DBE1714|nr:dihydrofolate reductase family protein [Serratia marcescens]MEB6080434.1 dihydrofolate reductase family protein [Serratia marcescens]